MDPDQARHFVRPDLGPNYLQKLSVDDKRKSKSIIEDVLLYVLGHIQIAQAPDRSEPDLNGEINYKYILQLLEDIGYDGFIGLEYKPRGK